MSQGIESSVRGIESALRDATRLRDRLDNLEPLLESIGAALEQAVQMRFDTKTDPDGLAWVPWSPVTAAARKEEGRGTLLEYTGRMRDSIGVLVGESSVEVFIGVPYAAQHELGQGLPRRAMLASPSTGSLGAADASAVLRAIEEYLND